MDCKFCGAPVKNGKCTFCGLDVKEYEAQTHSSCTSSSSYNLNGKEHKKNRFFHWHDENFDIFSAEKKARSKSHTLDQETYRSYNEKQDRRTKHDYDVDSYRSSYSTTSTPRRLTKTSSDKEDSIQAILSMISDFSEKAQQTASSSKTSSARSNFNVKSSIPNKSRGITSTKKTTYNSKASSSHNQVFGNTKEQKTSFGKSTATDRTKKAKKSFNLATLIIRIIIILGILEALFPAIASWFFSNNHLKFEDFLGNDFSINYENEEDMEKEEDTDFSNILDELLNR